MTVNSSGTCIKKQAFPLAVCAFMLCMLAGCGSNNPSTEAAASAPHITITDITYHAATQTAEIDAAVDTADFSADDYVIMENSRVEVSPSADGCNVHWYGFYNDISELNDLKVYHEFEEYSAVTNQATPQETTDALCLETAYSGHTIPVWITKYAVVICPDEDWRAENAFYNVTVTTGSGTQYFVCQLPGLDDRSKVLQDKEPLVNTQAETLETLGSGYESAAVLDHNGIQYITRENIDLSDIVSAEITQL